MTPNTCPFTGDKKTDSHSSSSLLFVAQRRLAIHIRKVCCLHSAREERQSDEKCVSSLHRDRCPRCVCECAFLFFFLFSSSFFCFERLYTLMCMYISLSFVHTNGLPLCSSNEERVGEDERIGTNHRTCIASVRSWTSIELLRSYNSGTCIDRSKARRMTRLPVIEFTHT